MPYMKLNMKKIAMKIQQLTKNSQTTYNMTASRMRLACEIADRMKSNNMTNEDLAKTMQVSLNEVEDWLSGTVTIDEKKKELIFKTIEFQKVNK